LEAFKNFGKILEFESLVKVKKNSLEKEKRKREKEEKKKTTSGKD
jgi:hypothetical protein